jgi:hypothetical protein
MADMTYRYTFILDDGNEKNNHDEDAISEITRPGPIPLSQGDFVYLGQRENQRPYMVQAVFARLWDDMDDNEIEYWVSVLEVIDDEEAA